MDEHGSLSSRNVQEDEASEAMDFTTGVPKSLTFTGSFDLPGYRLRLFTTLLESIPIPIFLLDSKYSIVFGNAACGTVAGATKETRTSEMSALFPIPHESEAVRKMAEATFATRKPHVTEATVKLRGEELCGRIHLRSLRMGDERFILALVEDLTLEKRQLLLTRRHQDELIKARKDLEKHVQDRTSELTAANIRLQEQILERRRAEEELLKSQNQLEQRVQERTSALRAINGRLITEILQRREAEKALKKSEDKFRTIFRHSLDVILVIDGDDGIIIDSNDAMKDVLNYDIGDIVGKHVSILYAHGDDPSAVGSLTDLRPHGAVFEAQRILRADGRTIPMDLTATLIPWEGGTAILATFRDVSDRESALEALRESEERYRTLFDQAANAIIVEDEDGSIVDVNCATAALTGYESNEIVSMKMSDLSCPVGTGAGDDTYIPVRCNNPTEMTVLHKDGSLIPVEVNRAQLKTGGNTFFLSIVSDITDRKKAEAALREAHQELEIRVDERTEELLEANKRLEQEITQRKLAEENIRRSLKEKEALLQEVHHRVKNNLQIISSLLALQTTHVGDEKTREVLTDSQSRIRSMAFIHEHLYQAQDLARIDFGAYARDLMGALLQSYSHVGNRVSLNLDLEPTFLGVGTALPCGLIMNELISNCLRHAFPDARTGEIAVRLRSIGANNYELSVVDDGVGLPRGLDYRLSNSLGLRLVTNLTELQLRGRLDVTSHNGTTVRIEFQDREQISTGGKN